MQKNVPRGYELHNIERVIIMNEKFHDAINITKYTSFVLLPSLSTFVGVIGLATNFEYTTLVITVMSALSVLLGQLIGEIPVKKPSVEVKEND